MKKYILVFTLAATLSIMAQTNPFLQPWTGAHGGVPAFENYKISQFKPALEEAMKQKLVEVDVIANNKQPATFQNTIVPLEKAGKLIRTGTGS